MAATEARQQAAGLWRRALRAVFSWRHAASAPLAGLLGGVIAPGYDARLDELRDIQDNCGAFLLALEARERERTGIATLKVEFNKVHGFYIEVTHASANSGHIPDDYRRRQTLKNAERYITPELKAFEDKALSAQERALTLEHHLWDELIAALAVHIPLLQRISRAIAELDGLTAFATAAVRFDYRQPEFCDAAMIDIEGGRHPVVERQVSSNGGNFIANDLNFSATRRLLLITGPNMGGKSTYMRQVAIIALLAHVGCFVPAQAAVLGEIDQICQPVTVFNAPYACNDLESFGYSGMNVLLALFTLGAWPAVTDGWVELDTDPGRVVGPPNAEACALFEDSRANAFR